MPYGAYGEPLLSGVWCGQRYEWQNEGLCPSK
jgi:hypothetical protein